jgi:hypothetical protein
LKIRRETTAATQLTQSARTRNIAASSAPSSPGAPPEMRFHRHGKTTNTLLRRATVFISAGKPWRLRNRGVLAFGVMLAVLFSTSSALAVEDIPPPFGFHWNDSMTKLEQVLNGAKAKIVTRERKEKRDVWTVEGLVQPGLRRTLFTFRDGFLVEVELQYEYPDWTIERYNDRMGEIRRYFDAKFGTGKLVSRTRDTDSDVVQTLVGYQWIVGGTMLELFYFSAQRDQLVFRSITVTYKAI